MDTTKILRLLERERAHIATEFHADIEGFFGSRARGDASEDSDLDVLVRFHEEAGVYELVGLGEFLEGLFHCRVDVVSVRAISDEFRRRVESELVHV